MAEARVPARIRVLSCPNCGGSVTLRAGGLTVSAVCGSCGATIDVLDENLRLIAEAAKRTRQPLIALGTRARLVGSLWEVVGYQLRADPVQGWSWEEYLLFSPYEGFRFLVHSEAEWTLYVMLRQDVPDPAHGAGDGQQYELLSTGEARTEYVLGEFYWRVRVGDRVTVTEYAAPPFLLSREQGGDEITWSRGVQLAGAAVEAAFHMKVEPTERDRTELHYAATRAILFIAGGATALLLFAVQASFGLHRNALLLQETLQATAADVGRPLALGPFAVPDAHGNLRIVAYSPVRNGWVQLGLSLVNQATQRSFDTVNAIERYSGVDEDGAWSEGSTTTSATFPDIPGGDYRLLIDVSAKAFQPPLPAPVRLQVSVTRHVPSYAFIWLSLLALWVYPAWRLLRDRFRPADAGA